MTLTMTLDLTGLTCGLIATLIYSNTWTADFVYDDTRAILQNMDIPSHAPLTNLLFNDFWGTPLSHSGSHKSFRPLTTLTFKLNYMLGGGYKPFSYHLTNTLLHGLVTYFFVILVKILCPSRKRPTSWISGLLFALHPIHTEAVAGIVGRADILCALFFILALLSYLKHTQDDSEEGAKRQGAFIIHGAATDGMGIANHDNNNGIHNHGKLCAQADNECRWRDKNGNTALFPEGKPRRSPSCSSKAGKRESWAKSVASDHHPSLMCSPGGGEKFHLGMTLVWAGSAMLSKELGVTVLGVCFLLDLLGPPRRLKAQSLTVLALGAAVLLCFRARAMAYATPTFAKADNPAASDDSCLTRFLTFAYLPMFNLGLMLCPVTLCFDWSMDAIPLISRLSDVRNLISVVGYALLGTVMAKNVIQPASVAALELWRGGQSGSKVGSIKQVTGPSLILMVLPFLPATNLLFYVGFVVAERILYVPSLGFCLLTAHCIVEQQWFWGWARIPRHPNGRTSGLVPPRKMGRALQAICCSMLLISSGLKTWMRNQDWKDEESLYRAGLKINPAKAYGNLANVLTQKGMIRKAEMAFKTAIHHRPNMADAHYNLGVLYQRESRIKEAIECYRKAIHFRPKLILAHLNLGLAYSTLGHKEESLTILEDILSIDDDGLKDPQSHANTQISAMFNMGMILLELGRAREAIPVLRRAEALGRRSDYEHSRGVLHLLGEAYQAVNQTAQAEYWYQAATSYKPHQVSAFLKYGKMLAKNKTRLSEAEEWFSKAKTIAPNDPSVHLHLGLFLMDADRNLEAANHFELASNLNPMDYESAFNAGVAFRVAGRNRRAEEFYRKAVHIKPNDPSSHMNLGAMLHLAGKLTEAEDHYLEAWQLRPGDPATQTNLQRLHNIMRGRGIKVRTFH